MTEEERFSIGRNALGMQFICYDDDGILVGTFIDKIGLKEIVDLLNEQDKRIKELEQEVETLQDQLAHDVSDLCDDVE